MAELKVVIKDSTNQIFRKRAMERIGYGKGALSIAADEALRAWVSMPEKIRPRHRSKAKLELDFKVDPKLVDKVIDEIESTVI